MRTTMLSAALGVALAAGAGAAHAEEVWRLRLEAPAAVPVTLPQRSLFGAGGMPSVALHRRAFGDMWANARLRAGFLPDAGSPGDEMLADPGAGGLMSATLGMRWSSTAGPWVELGGGAALTGRLWRGTTEAAAGWSFELGPMSVGPTVRYVHIHQPDSGLDGRDAGLALIGLELGRGTGRPATAPPRPLAPAPTPPRVELDLEVTMPPAEKLADSDGDGIADIDDHCPREPEVVNGIDDDDGCPDEGLIELVDDRIVLEERVLFDLERARVKSGARPVLAAIIALWQQNSDWERVVIEGHADVRGSEQYNQWLSEERATRVKAALVDLGVSADRIEVRGLGSSHPRDLGASEEAHRRNRRVEFVIVRELQVRR